jgi:hypothetical protein
VADVRAIYDRFGTWIRKYKGGMPGGMIAAVIQHESGGNPNAIGDATLGEQGLMQIEASFPAKVGLSPSINRLDPEINIFLGSLEQQLRAIEFLPYSPLGTPDSWKLARLSFAVGSAGTRRLIDAATGGKPALYRGRVFETVRSWANQTGAIALSSGQPADKVVARINAVQSQWDVGQSISGFYGPPQKIPAPKGLAYSVPATAARYLMSPIASTIVALGILGIVVFLATRPTPAPGDLNGPQA